MENLRLYSDPECKTLCEEIAKFYNIKPENVFPTNGSDEALAFCFDAFGEGGAQFPDVTYGFYKVFATFFGVKYTEIPLKKDFTVDVQEYLDCNKMVVLANPNAQTGIYLPLEEIEKIVANNPKHVVVIDEAYVDFGGESAVSLIDKYNNLVVVQTFSKSRSLAGARVGFAMAQPELIADLKRVKYSFHPYNVNRLSSKIASIAIQEVSYFKQTCVAVVHTREKVIEELVKRDFHVLPSLANFVLAKHTKIKGEELYLQLKQRGILVRHFNDERIAQYVRISMGTNEQMEELFHALDLILRGLS
jgi:histidinol-phosphate aminotransferase